MLSAGLWVPASLISFLCVRDLGIALGQGVWAGCVALISFLWGQLYFKAGMNDPALGCVGIAVLVAGISSLGILSGGGGGGEEEEEGGRSSVPAREGAGAATAGTSSSAATSLKVPLVSVVADATVLTDSTTTTTTGDEGGRAEAGVGAPGPLAGAAGATEAAAAAHRPRKLRGLLLAFCVGLGAGSTMVPLRLAPRCPYRADGLTPLIFAVCFGASALIVAVAIFGAYCAVRALALRLGPPPMQLRTCALPSMLSGLIWTLGNAGGVLATQEPLGLTVGYPITQACLLVAGLCGILVYGEVRGRRAILRFFAASVVVVAGATLLGVYGSAASSPAHEAACP